MELNHRPGCRAGDAQELQSIDAVYGSGDAKRDTHNPLLLGSVKSNMGHCEGGSGLAGAGPLPLESIQETVLLLIRLAFRARNFTNETCILWRSVCFKGRSFLLISHIRQICLLSPSL